MGMAKAEESYLDEMRTIKELGLLYRNGGVKRSLIRFPKQAEKNVLVQGSNTTGDVHLIFHCYSGQRV